MTVRSYIKANWENTIKTPDQKKREVVRIPQSYSVPCADHGNGFTDFYYWDTYFANLGLMLDGKVQQAENNLDVMSNFIRQIGYMPNGNHLLERSQPPLFTRGVWDLYTYTGKKEVIRKFLPAILTEYQFFQQDRTTKIGLNQYSSELNRSRAMVYYPIFSERVGEFRDSEEEKIRLTKDLMAIAESGWDFTPRFHTPKGRYQTGEFVHLDLNCLLYDMEMKISEMFTVLGDQEQTKIYQNYAKNRKDSMQKYMLDKDSGIFYDYNFVQDLFSSATSVASFYPYAVGISDDKKAAKKLMEKLELEFGITACESRGEKEEYLQWDYPNMWPSNVYFTYMGLKKAGLEEDAKRIAGKYLETVERCFLETGTLWEKYDALKGKVSVTNEYETPAMMGWTAGVYRFLESEIRGEESETNRCHDTKIRVYDSDVSKNCYYHEKELTYGNLDENAKENRIDLIDDVEYQKFLGFGGVFTEEAAYQYSLLDTVSKQELLNKYFDQEKGISYSLGCISGSFENLAQDKKYIIPFVKDAMKACQEKLVLIASPWSLEEKQKISALDYVGYVKAYRAEGIPITAVCVQPKRDFIQYELLPTFEEEGLFDVKIIILDHHKESIYESAKEVLMSEAAAEKIWTVGYHQCCEDHFEGLSLLYEKFQKPNICTEADIDDQELKTSLECAEKYAKSICQNFNHYMIAFLGGKLFKEDTLTDCYMGHFSKYVKRGAKRLGVTKFTDKLYACAFRNPDETIVVVLLNPTDQEQALTLRYKKKNTSYRMQAHSIATVVIYE